MRLPQPEGAQATRPDSAGCSRPGRRRPLPRPALTARVRTARRRTVGDAQSREMLAQRSGRGRCGRGRLRRMFPCAAQQERVSSSTTSAMRCLGKQSFALGGQRQGRDAPPRAFGTLVLELPRRSPPSERVRQCTVRLARSSRGICGWRRAKEWVGEGVVGRAEGGVAAHGEARRARWFRMAVGRRRRVRKCERVCASVEGGAERGQRA